MQIKKDIKIIWKYLKKYKNKVYFIVFMAIIASAVGAVIPYIYGRLVDIAIDEAGRIELIFGILGLWLVLTLIVTWVNRYVNRESTDVSVKSSNDFVLDATNHVMRLPISFHKDKRIGEILQRIGRAGGFFESIIDETVFSVAPGLLRAIIGLAILAFVEWRLSLIICFVMAFYVLATILKTKPILKTQKTLNRAYEKGYGDIYNAMYNVQVVKSSVGEALERNKNIKNFSTITQRVYNFMEKWVSMGTWQQTIFGFGFVFVFAIGIFLLRSRSITAGEFVMFVGYISMVYQPIFHLAHNYRNLKRGMAVIERALSLFRVKKEKYEKGIVVRDIEGDVVFEKVSFSYKKGKLVLKHLSFKAKPGEMIALVGESGVGKTTLVDLISRYYSPTKGRILIDDYDIQKINLSSLRKHIAIVPQEISLFNNTIKNNIAYGKPRATMEEIIKVAKAANAHEFIQKFPKKYKQLVGQRGIKLSTGQKQRVAIARALLRDSRILILDEATSSLDSESEKKVQEALKRLIKGRTTFIIAHRLSTICRADKIIVIEKGEIAETGTHDRLMRRKNGIYQKFFRMQSAFEEDMFQDKT